MFSPITDRRQACLDLCGEDALLFMDGHDDAIIGVAERDGAFVVVYDQKRVLRKLCQRDGMDDEEAEEFFEFNIAGAFMGDQTPIFMMMIGRIR
jgi:hypothetical protein